MTIFTTRGDGPFARECTTTGAMCLGSSARIRGGASPEKREHAEFDAAGSFQGVVLWTAAETRVGAGLDMSAGARSESASQLLQHLRSSEGLQMRDDMFSARWSVA
jgi:hypothetical protein